MACATLQAPPRAGVADIMKGSSSGGGRGCPGAALARPPTRPPLARPRPASSHPTLALPFLATLFPPSAEVAAKDELIALVTDPALARGAKGGPAARARVEAAIDACIAAAGRGDRPATAADKGINGVWELVWTTEKETLSIANTIGPLFRRGAPTGGIYQVIDVRGRALQNVITFPPGDGAFVVDSTCGPDDPASPSSNPSRLNFKFNAARLDAWGKEGWLTFPPVGQGWFDTVWLSADSTWRAARDVRGDTLVVRRVVGGKQKW